MHRILGWVEEVNVCDCCGKSGLSGTFAVDLNGETLHYGSTCVTRNTGVKNPKSAAEAYLRERRATARKLIEQTDEYRAYRTVLDGSNYRVDKGLENIGDSRPAIQAAARALDAVTRGINAAHGL